MLATENGLYLGSPQNQNVVPRKVLPLEKVSQVHVLEEFQLLLVLADGTLWQYPLDIIINGNTTNGNPLQHFGRKIQTNIPFFHVGECLSRTLICVPKASSTLTNIELYEPTMPKTEQKKKRSVMDRLSLRTTLSLMNTQVVKYCTIYSPSEVWAIDTTKSLILLTTPLGMVAVNMHTKKPDGK
jgi:hypothetical protein